MKSLIGYTLNLLNKVVLFINSGEKVICRYKVTGGLYPHAKDKVCLFRLGWISAQDYKATVYAPMLPKYQAGMMFDSAVSFEG